jgi:flagellar hook-associated protein 1 FlgK
LGQTPVLQGLSLTQFYGNIAAGVGQQAASASASATSQTSMLNQAQNLRAQVSGVSLNDQASKLMEFQQAYQASAQMISVINSLSTSLMSMLQAAGI